MAALTEPERELVRRAAARVETQKFEAHYRQARVSALKSRQEAERHQMSEVARWADHQASLVFKLGQAGEEVYAWVQCIQPQHGIEDIVVGGHHQHLTPFAGEVLLLPLGVASWLVSNRPSEWRQTTVYPGTVILGSDGASGLDIVSAVTTGTWGYDPVGGAFFTADGDVGQNQPAYLLLDSNDNVWVTQ